MIAQYKGYHSKKGINDSFYCNLYFTLLIAIVFILTSLIKSKQIMALYSDDLATINQAAIYLKIMTIGFIPQTITLMISTLLRNMECAKIPLVASATSVIINTILNYLLIFGIGFFPKMDVAGAALATSLSRVIEFLIVFVLYLKVRKSKKIELKPVFSFEISLIKKTSAILGPVLLCEFLWSLGENVYAVIYGHIGTEQCAAMTLTYPIQTIVIGALSGVSAATGIVVGKSLGEGNNDKAYYESKKFVELTMICAVIISAFLAITARYYVKLFHVSEATRNVTVHILYAYSLVFCAKVINMVLGGGVLRSGGQTKFIMIIDIVGTWIIGVPLGFFTAYVLKLPIYKVYFILSLEEFVRTVMELYVFRSKRWMVNVAKSVSGK